MEKPPPNITLFMDESYPERIRLRGEQYFLQERVGEITYDDEFQSYDAFVFGSEMYLCSVEFPEDRIDVSCDCPYFRRHGYCKHLYAFALAFDQLGESAPSPPSSKTWRSQLERTQSLPPTSRRTSQPTPFPPRHYLLPPHLDPGEDLHVFLAFEKPLKSGPIRLRPQPLMQIDLQRCPEQDLKIIARLQNHFLHSIGLYYYNTRTSKSSLPTDHLLDLLADMADTGRLHLSETGEHHNLQHLPPLHNALDQSWEFFLQSQPSDNELILQGALRLGDQIRPLDQPRFIHPQGLILWDDHFSRLHNPETFGWITQFRQHPQTVVPKEDQQEFINTFFNLPALPPADLPENLAPKAFHPTPEPLLRLEPTDPSQPDSMKSLLAEPEFRYKDHSFHWMSPQTQFVDLDQNLLIHRDRPAEEHALALLESLGGTIVPDPLSPGGAHWRFPSSKLSEIFAALDHEGWEILLRDKRLRTGGALSLMVQSSGVDWFDVHGKVNFGDQSLAIPELLAKADSSNGFIRLKGGEIGVLPPSIQEKLGLLQRLSGETNPNGNLRFSGAQTLLLDILLADLPEVDWNQKARRLRNRLRSLDNPAPVDPPKHFHGQLREYQREGLGWLRHLRETRLNGCLADDMGLGKTVQVLALLEEQRQANTAPSLAVLPKSLLFNWQQEAARFTPKLRVQELIGPSRPKSPDQLPKADFYLTSYQTLIRDIHWLKNFNFDYVILDESQAVKNPTAKTSKAVRLLSSNHRLTLTGTPVENRLDDLWSQLNFLNPGMLGNRLLASKDFSPATLELISKSVRPFLLRRTKEQVAADLPPKVEETLFCELPARQRKLYNDLKTYYRVQLAAGITQEGFGKSKFMVLEALLRLRQAACHPGLVSPEHAKMDSAKLNLLAELLEDILASGHKALIFSQFTSMLDLVRAKLDHDHTPYAYLDGQTRDRTAPVQQFQNDPHCPLFLISLKAGGVGLNLTAADYVILLDPWWNPAVEAQAIDRAHRIGQTKNVFAYRIVAKDTIEEKILSLQDDKRHLAESILTRENSLLAKLTPEDLSFLLA